MRLLRVLVPLMLLAVVWQVADGRVALARIAGADPGWLVLAFAALQGQTLLSALRWSLVSGALGQPIPAGRAVRGVWPGQLLLSAAIVTLNLVAFAAVARATGTSMTPEAALTLIPLILLSIAGWGWCEGAAAALFPLAGAAPEAGLAASAVYGALMLAAAVPGAFWLARPAALPPV